MYQANKAPRVVQEHPKRGVALLADEVGADVTLLSQRQRGFVCHCDGLLSYDHAGNAARKSDAFCAWNVWQIAWFEDVPRDENVPALAGAVFSSHVSLISHSISGDLILAFWEHILVIISMGT